MSLTLSTPTSQYSRALDLSRGDAGALLREAIQDASTSTPRDRGAEILVRLSAALGKARQQDGILVDPDAFGRMLEILELLPNNVPLPQIVVESEKEIGLDWDEGPSRVLTVTVRETPMLGFAALLGVEPLHGRLRFAEELPQTLRFLLGRLYPQQHD